MYDSDPAQVVNGFEVLEARVHMRDVQVSAAIADLVLQLRTAVIEAEPGLLLYANGRAFIGDEPFHAIIDGLIYLAKIIAWEGTVTEFTCLYLHAYGYPDHPGFYIRGRKASPNPRNTFPEFIDLEFDPYVLCAPKTAKPGEVTVKEQDKIKDTFDQLAAADSSN